jgi:hypothetical protein
MRLSPEELQRLSSAMIVAFPDYDAFDRFSLLHLGFQLSTIIDRSPTRSVVTALLKWAEGREGRWESFLHEAVRFEPPPNPVLEAVCKAILDRLTTPPLALPAAAPATGPAQLPDTILLLGHQPFMNRDDVRTAVRALTSPNDIRVLVAYGGPETGKSYLYEYLNFLNASGWLAMELAIAEVGKHVTADVDLGSLAEILASQFGVGTLPPALRAGETPETWARRVALWFRNQLRPAFGAIPGPPKWIVLDGFDRAGVTPATRDFILGLADWVCRDLHSCRMVVLGWPREQLAFHRSLSTVYETASLDEPQWRAFFNILATYRLTGKDSNLLVEGWIDEVKMQVPSHAPRRLAALADRCRQITLRHLTVRGPGVAP